MECGRETLSVIVPADSSGESSRDCVSNRRRFCSKRVLATLRRAAFLRAVWA